MWQPENQSFIRQPWYMFYTMNFKNKNRLVGMWVGRYCPALRRATDRDHFARRLSIRVCVCPSDNHTFLVVTL